MRSPGGPPASDVCTGRWRLARGATVSIAALAISVAGHLITGDTLPTPATLTGIWAASAALSWVLSGHRWTGRELAVVLVLVQAAIHTTCVVAPHSAIADLEPTLLAGHIAATGLCVQVLARTEAALWQLATTYLLRPLTAVDAAAVVSRAPRPPSTNLSWRGATAKMARLLIIDSPLRAPPRPL